MAKPKYRLQALLVIKDRAKKKAELELARAILALKEAKEKLEKLKKEKDAIIAKWKLARKEMKEKMQAGSCVGEGNLHVNYLRKLKEDEDAKEEEIRLQKEVVEECTEAVAVARRGYIDASKELRIMEKHKELWEKKLKDELTRKEEREMDELGSTIHELKRWRGEKSIFEVK